MLHIALSQFYEAFKAELSEVHEITISRKMQFWVQHAGYEDFQIQSLQPIFADISLNSYTAKCTFYYRLNVSIFHTSSHMGNHSLPIIFKKLLENSFFTILPPIITIPPQVFSVRRYFTEQLFQKFQIIPLNAFGRVHRLVVYSANHGTFLKFSKINKFQNMSECLCL